MATAADPIPPQSARRPAPRARWTLALVCVTTFMFVLDITVVILALPAIQTSFRASLNSLQWVIDAYTLALAALLLTAATLGDRLGRRRLFLVGTAIFTASSLACALAPSVAFLDVSRVVEGIGGAVIFGVGLPLIAADYPKGQSRDRALAAFGAASGGAIALGPLIAGVLIGTVGWRYIFFLNVPIGIAVISAAWTHLAESRDAAATRPDWWGTTTITASLVALVFGLIQANHDGWTSPTIIALFVTAAVTFAVFVVIERHQAEPMLDLTLFTRASFATNGLVAFTTQATLLAALTFLSLYVQNTLGYSALGAGVRFLPFTVVTVAVALAASRLLGRIPSRLLLAVTAAFAAAGLAAMAHLNATSTWTALIAGFVLGGVGLGLVSTVVNQVALDAVAPERAGMASGATNALKQVGVAVGVAALGAVFIARTTTAATQQLAASRLPADTLHAIITAIASGAGQTVLPHLPARVRPLVGHAAAVATASGLNLVLLCGAATAAVAAITALTLTPARPRSQDE